VDATRVPPIAQNNDDLIEIVPRRGIRVVPLTVADMREVYDLLRWLESQAAHALVVRATAREGAPWHRHGVQARAGRQRHRAARGFASKARSCPLL
jgi:DNA-binding GntR family transcriptional regulator